MKKFDELTRSLERYAKQGERKLPNGARLLGRVPHVGPEAYLHSVFPGLDKGDIGRLERQAGRPVPDPLREFYACYNGLHLFSGSLSIYGLRDSSVKGEAGKIGQPFGIGIANVDERIEGAEEDAFFFGFYDWDGSQLFMSPRSPVVVRCARHSPKALNRWPDLETALSAEVRRLAKLFDDKGRQLDEDNPTAPSPVA